IVHDSLNVNLQGTIVSVGIVGYAHAIGTFMSNLEKETPSSKDPALWSFEQTADSAMNIYALSDAGYGTITQKTGSLGILAARGLPRTAHWPLLFTVTQARASRFHRMSSLNPPIFKGRKVRRPSHDFVQHHCLGGKDACTGLAEQHLHKGNKQDRGQLRLLLVDSLFPVTPEFFVTSWEMNVICLCVLKRASEYLSPFESGTLDSICDLH
ncbi:hypothetical protein N7463_006554, partial [Penicillium fimorum]